MAVKHNTCTPKQNAGETMCPTTTKQNTQQAGRLLPQYKYSTKHKTQHIHAQTHTVTTHTTQPLNTHYNLQNNKEQVSSLFNRCKHSENNINKLCGKIVIPHSRLPPHYSNPQNKITQNKQNTNAQQQSTSFLTLRLSQHAPRRFFRMTQTPPGS